MSADSSRRASTEDFEEKLAGPLSEVVPAGPEHDELYIDPAREAQLVRKLDMRIAPVMCAVFLLAYLDRSVSLCLRCRASRGLTPYPANQVQHRERRRCWAGRDGQP